MQTALTPDELSTGLENINIPATGFPEIDHQHRKLLATLVRLKHWHAAGRGWGATFDTLAALGEYADEHFTYEERLLEELGYPGLDQHRKQHQRLKVRLDVMARSMLSEGEAGDAPISDGAGILIKLLQDWILEHIGEEDLEFARHFGRTAR